MAVKTIIVTVIVGILLKALLDRIAGFRRFKSAQKPTGCLPVAAKYAHIEPIFGLDFFWTQLHRQYGRTYEVKELGNIEVHSIDPRNLQAVAATQFGNFGFGPLRGDIGVPFFGNGVLTVDGDYWKNSRAVVKPGFDRAEVANLASFEKHVQRFMDLIPRKGETFDMQALTDRLVDSGTEFIFGESMESLLPQTPFNSTKFLDAFERCLLHVGLKEALRSLGFLMHLDRGFKPAYQTVHEFVDRNISETLERRRVDENMQIERERYILLDRISEHLQDPVQLRDQIMNVFLASRVTVSPASANTFWYLSQHPKWWNALREEALNVSDLTYETMKSLKVTKAIVNETFRLNSPAQRVRKAALRDTILPKGGGADGESPLFVPKGRVVEINLYCLHHDHASWGEDADEFRPDRWLDPENRPLWEAKWQCAPFFGGLRMCPAQNQVLVQISYLLVRIAREFEKCEFRDEVKQFEQIARFTIVSRRGVRVALQ